MTLKERLKKFDLLPVVENTTEDVLSPEILSLCKTLSKELSSKIAAIPVWFDYTQDEQRELILNFLKAKLSDYEGQRKLSEAEKDKISSYFINSVYGFGALDYLLAQKEVKSIFIKSSDNILINLNGDIVKSDVTIDKKHLQFLINRLKEYSNQDCSVINFRFNNLSVTIVLEPVCNPQLVLKKISDIKFNYEFLEKSQILNADIANFFKAAFSLGKHFLISASSGVGKTALLNAFINETEENVSKVVFENGNFIISDCEHYNIENLTLSERIKLINAVVASKPKNIFSDLNEILFNLELADRLPQNTGFAACITAESPADAINFFTLAQTANYKCSDKYAKVKFTKYFDYIIQLEKSENFFVIKNIFEVTTNGAGTPELSERLSFSAGEYKYDFPAAQVIVPPANADPVEEQKQEPPAKKHSFKARFSD